MAVTVKVNGTGNSLVHKGSDGVSTATLPDVCKTPSPGGPVPVPYPNVAFSSDLANGSTTVKADGGKMIAVKGSEFRRSTGDEPGTAGGVKSNTFAKEATWLTYSFDVKIDGRNACRLTDNTRLRKSRPSPAAAICGCTFPAKLAVPRTQASGLPGPGMRRAGAVRTGASLRPSSEQKSSPIPPPGR
jgi:hypothetical protein